MRKDKVWIPLGVGLLTASTLTIGSLSDARGEQIALFLLSYLAAFIGYLILAGKFDRFRMSHIIILAVILRLLLISSQPTLSEDAYRYVWEGRVVRHGYKPYTIPPDSPALDGIRDGVFYRMNYRHLTASYPPYAILLFAIIGSVSEKIIWYKTVFAAADVAVGVAIARLLTSAGNDKRLCMLYLFNPLAVVEVAGSGHFEPLALLPMVVGLLLAKKSGRLSAAILGFASSVKFFPAFTFAYLNRKLSHYAVFLFAFALPYLAFLNGAAIFSQIGNYGLNWSFNGFAEGFVRPVASILGVQHLTNVICWLILLTAFIHICRRRGLNPLGKSYWFFTCFLFCSPVVHPWYVLWGLPFAVALKKKAYLGFSGLVVLSYALYPIPSISWIVKVVEYGLFAAMTWVEEH